MVTLKIDFFRVFFIEICDLVENDTFSKCIRCIVESKNLMNMQKM